MEVEAGVQIHLNNKWLEDYAKEYINKLYAEKLKPEWLTISDLEHITSRKRQWVMENIIYDPYVRENGIAKRDSDSKKAQWLIDSERIRPFLKKLFSDLPNY